MKNPTKASQWLLMAGMMMFIAIGCGGQKQDQSESQMLVVERQHFRLIAHNPYVNKGDFAIDIPISGPQQLIDSLKVFLNHELYKDIENYLDNSVHFTEKEMYQDNLTGMMSYYEEKYKPFEEELKDPACFNLFLIAQTESFVTYGMDCCGGRGAVFYCHTFSKKDGHKLGETITKTNLLRFMGEHPEIENPFSETGIPGGDWAFFDLGLLEDGAICVNEDWQNYYYAQKFDYKELMPYLSKEAQEFIKEKGATKYSYESWLMGEQIGKVETTDHETIFLMYRPPLWEGFACFAGGPISDDEDSVYDPFHQDKVYTLTAYTNKDGQYVRKDVFPTPRFEFEFPNWACSKPASFDDDEFFVYNEADNMLFVPYVTEAKEVYFLSYKFDGQHFKPISPEETKPLGKVIGWVVSDSNDSICFVEGTNVESFSTNVGGIGLAAEGVSAYYVRDHLYVPARIFPYQRSTLEFRPGA